MTSMRRLLVAPAVLTATLLANPWASPVLAQESASAAVLEPANDAPRLEQAPANEAGPLQRDQRVARLVEANAAYQSGDFRGARDLYREVADSGVANGQLQYNLGNASLRSGLLGESIAAYLRASALRPRDQDVLANLQFARTQAKDALEPPAPSEVWRTLAFWHFSLSLRELVFAVLGLNALFWLALALRAQLPRSEAMRWLSGLLLIALVAVGVSTVWRLVAPAEVAVVVADEAEALSGFTEDAVARFKLREGSEVVVRERRETHVRVALPTGEQGWLAVGDVDVVRR